ncbi:uncharacterized protein M421DRAFT_417666 [Didymella exigua CBS 183.55]|uniref:Uncharacterized protein n=1 Tax=Didymella exigua CBS 183.55 TaxID=1150837 RepID=A0A6A5RVN7_9PLEO|nr:uncharacterized protein M421DRAFT_417666 [Didymella exigua CBS 183.55]KAF1931932.1 hypothetical protein M421DRAFT_417666 [Didymella exigua CBS 183.55]
MPSFAFWKSSKLDESQSPLLSDAAVKELSVIIPNVSKAVDLNPGNQDSGVFLFDEDAQEIPGDQTPIIGPTPGHPIEKSPEQPVEPTQPNTSSATDLEISLLEVHEPSPHRESPALVPEEPLVQTYVEATEQMGSQQEMKEEVAAQAKLPLPELRSLAEPSPVLDSTQDEEHVSTLQSRPVSLVPKESDPTLAVEKSAVPAALGKIETGARDRDSGIYLSDNESSSARSRPSSIASNETAPLRSRVTSLSKPSTSSPQRTNSIARLQRPAELNLGFSGAQNTAKPKSELDMRYDLIRNSKTRSKAALRSPTQLLQDRLNMSPKKKEAERVRIFTPPRVTVNGCLLPGPSAQAEAFTSTSVRARTETGGRPSWWCKFDKLVVFDGIEQADGEMRLRTRTSKGLTIARRQGDLETVVIPLDCTHCHEMLNRHEWKYDMRVCKRSVCWDCKERCKWEFEQERIMTATTPRADANRDRADSVLQDGQVSGHVLRKEIIA